MRHHGLIMMIAGWLLLAVLIWWVMDRQVDEQLRPNAELARIEGPRGEVVLKRGRDGHYSAPGRINGQPVFFLVDTGATQVAIPQTLANRLGLRPGLAFRAHTANGVVVTYATRLASVSLGGLTAEDVAGTILPDMPGDGVLLGMSFLARFDVSIQDGEMRLRAR